MWRKGVGFKNFLTRNTWKYRNTSLKGLDVLKMPEKSKTHIIPNGGLTVIYNGKSEVICQKPKG